MQTMKNSTKMPKTEKVRMFAPFKDEQHYNQFHNAVMNGIPKKHHWDIMLLTQMMISTFREEPEVADKLFK